MYKHKIDDQQTHSGTHSGSCCLKKNQSTPRPSDVAFFTLIDQASTIPSNIRSCQSGTWSQRGTKVNVSHHGDKPLKYSDQQGSKSRQKAMRLYKRWHRPITKTVHQTSFTPYREQPRSTRIVVAYPRPTFSARPAFSATNRTNTFQPVVLINNSKFLCVQNVPEQWTYISSLEKYKNATTTL